MSHETEEKYLFLLIGCDKKPFLRNKFYFQ